MTYKDLIDSLHSKTLKEVEAIWAALGELPWNGQTMYNDTVTMDEWVEAVYSRLGTLRTIKDQQSKELNNG